MTGFYNVTKKIKDALAAEPFVNTVSFGSLDDVDLNKQTIFPLSHIIVNNCNVGSNTMTFNISILAMDIVDESKVEGAVGCEPFVDRFENKLAGWAATFDVIVQNDMTVC